MRVDIIIENMNNSARDVVLQSFNAQKTDILCFNDNGYISPEKLSIRGMDFESIFSVVNFQIPLDSNTYQHRIGRLCRTGADNNMIAEEGYVLNTYTHKEAIHENFLINNYINQTE